MTKINSTKSYLETDGCWPARSLRIDFKLTTLQPIIKYTQQKLRVPNIRNINKLNIKEPN